MKLEKVDYFWGMYESAAKADMTKAEKHHIFTAPDIPEAVRQSFEQERIYELSGDYGLPGAGSPTQVDVLSFVVDGEEKRIRVINRAISMFTMEDEEIKRLHRFFGVVDRAATMSQKWHK